MNFRLQRMRHMAAMAGLLILLGGCASSGTVVLLPEKDGRQTAVVVKQGDKEVVLDKPYAAANTTAIGPRAFVASPQDVDAKFGPALAAQPARATSFTLYFVEGKDEFTEQSKQVVYGIMAEIAKRSVPDVLVIGHTDTVGSDQANDVLGQQRAEIVRVALIRLGIPSDDIHAISRGKRARAEPPARPLPGRDPRPLTPPPSVSATPLGYAVPPGPNHRNASTVTSSAGSAGPTNSRTSVPTASTRSRAVALPACTFASTR